MRHQVDGRRKWKCAFQASFKWKHQEFETFRFRHIFALLLEASTKSFSKQQHIRSIKSKNIFLQKATFFFLRQQFWWKNQAPQNFHGSKNWDDDMDHPKQISGGPEVVSPKQQQNHQIRPCIGYWGEATKNGTDFVFLLWVSLFMFEKKTTAITRW